MPSSAQGRTAGGSAYDRIYSSSQQRTAEQSIDIPAQGRGDRGGGGGALQSSRPGQNSAALGGAVHVDIPVPHGRGGRVGQGGLQGVSQGQGSTALCGSDLIDIPVPRSGSLQGFLPGQGSAASSSSSHSPGAVDEAFTGVFRTLLQNQKSARLGPRSGSELGADFNAWTPAADAESMAVDDDESETESDSEVEEDALTRFGAGFRLGWFG